MLLISLQEKICCVAIVYVTVLLIIIPAPSAEVNWKVLGSVEVLWVIRRRILFLQVTVKWNSHKIVIEQDQ